MIIIAWYFYKFQHDFCGVFLCKVTQVSEDKENDLTFITILFVRSTQQTTSIKPVACLVHTMFTACIPTVFSI